MSKREYVAMHRQTDRKITYKYDFFGTLQGLKFSGEKWSAEQVKFILEKRLPLTETQILELCERKDLDFDFKPVPADLSFKAFWNIYGKKVGKIERTQKLWATIPEDEKSEILLYLEKFNKKFIGNPYKPYPETFLSQKMWMAEKI